MGILDEFTETEFNGKKITRKKLKSFEDRFVCANLFLFAIESSEQLSPHNYLRKTRSI